MKRLQTKCQADTTSDSEVISQKMSKFIIRSKLMVRSKFLAAQFFFFVDVLLKIQQQILI